MTLLRLSDDPVGWRQLLGRLTPAAGERRVVGLAGEPGAGKSTLAAALGASVGPAACVVPLDGFHLADVALRGLGLLDRKGAPETFDAPGYAALLGRLRQRTDTVYAPMFERDLEQPLAGALPVPPEAEVVITEGNYLLLDRPEWRAARAQLDEVWFVQVDQVLRRTRLVARHVAFGKSPSEAADWVERVDEPNAELVRSTRERADLVVDVTAWVPA